MSMPDLIKSIEKVDDMTVKFVLTRPEAPFIANLAMDFASIVSGIRRRLAGRRHADAEPEARSAPARSSSSPISRTR
jgi:hypothetical protein